MLNPVFSFLFSQFIPDYHVYLQGLLAGLVLYIVFKKSGPPKKRVSAKEESRLIDAWKPAPLVEPIDKNDKRLKQVIVNNQWIKFIEIENKLCLNFATHNYLGLAKRQSIVESLIQAVRKYGVGSCGPRGFYGTQDVHLQLEEKLAKFMGTEEAVVYSYGFSTISSAIPAYAKKNDVLFVDECVNFAIQKGLDASRSGIKFFKHNDMDDLERLLKEQSVLDLKNKRKAAKTRRFIIVEGIYAKTGNLCPLPKIMELKVRYKLRLFVDESVSFGTIGENGKGVTDYFGIPVEDVDLIMSSMEGSLATVGGFCVGSSFIVEHQRISGLGYCFSASLPPMLIKAAMEALDIIEETPSIVRDLNETSKLCDSLLRQSDIVNDYFEVSGSAISPLKHLFVKSREPLDEIQLNEIVTRCREEGVAFCKPAYLDLESLQMKPSIRLTLNALHTSSDVENSIVILEKSIKDVVNSKI